MSTDDFKCICGATTHQSSLPLSYVEASADPTLHALILDVVDSISEEDERGAWTIVVRNRVSMNSHFNNGEVEEALTRMIDACALFISCHEHLDGIFSMKFVKTAPVVSLFDRFDRRI